MFRSRLLIGALALLTVSAAFSYARADAGRDSSADLEPGPTAASSVADALDSHIPPAQPGSELILIREKLPRSLPALQLSRVIGVLGGSVSLAGHQLTVPARAVALPTIFTLTLLPSGNVEVELGAVMTSLLGRRVDLGNDGLRRPVELTLMYGRAQNLDDPQRLRIVRVGSDDAYELMPTHIDTAARSVSTRVEHLARYRLVAE